MTRVVAVVAMAANNVIGRGGDMPWRLATDLKRYRRLTMGKPMIMGRKTLVSVGRVLDGRDSVVLTRGDSLPFDGAHLVGSAEAAMALAETLARQRGTDEIVIAGGGEIYRQFFDRIDRLYVTHVEAEPEGDALFPAIIPAHWKIVESAAIAAGESDSAASRFVIYDRI